MKYYLYAFTFLSCYLKHYFSGSCGIMLVVVWNGFGNLTSNPGQDCLYQANTLVKSMNLSVLALAIGK